MFISNEFSKAIDVQGRVLWALCLREIHGKHGKFRIGYLWQLIKTVFGVSVFWWIRETANFHPPQGLSTPIFLLMGFIPWYIFSETVSMVMEAVSTNKALLTFPQVTPLDLCLGSAIVAAATEIVVLVLFLMAISIAGYDTQIHNLGILLLCLVGVVLLGLGTGLFFLALNFYLPLIEKLVPMVMRIMFFVTGVFYSPLQMAGRFGDGVMWLPTANIIELSRGVFVGPVPPDGVKAWYTVFFILGVLVLGLLLERHVRPLQEAS